LGPANSIDRFIKVAHLSLLDLLSNSRYIPQTPCRLSYPHLAIIARVFYTELKEDKLKLAGKYVVVTGASTGIGRAIALGLTCKSNRCINLFHRGGVNV
jgi:hypothetical protein